MLLSFVQAVVALSFVQAVVDCIAIPGLPQLNVIPYRVYVLEPGLNFWPCMRACQASQLRASHAAWDDGLFDTLL